MIDSVDVGFALDQDLDCRRRLKTGSGPFRDRTWSHGSGGEEDSLAEKVEFGSGAPTSAASRI
jgi:hypothetical protein